MRATTCSTILMLAGLGALQLNAQISPATPRIHEALDENRRVALKGNTHPLVQTRFDRGAAPADLPMERMMMLLQRVARPNWPARHLFYWDRIPAAGIGANRANRPIVDRQSRIGRMNRSSEEG